MFSADQIVPTNTSPEIDSGAREAAHEIARTQQDLQLLAEEVGAQESETSKTTTIDNLADQLHAELGHDKEEVIAAIEAELQTIGIEDGKIPQIELLISDLTASSKARLLVSHKTEKADKHASITSRFTELKETDMPLQSLLKTLREEFKGSIDEEVNLVLGRYEALFSEEVLPNKEERKAVETLFLSQDVPSFTTASFSGFVHTLYEQPDSVISEETKARIEKKFQIPRQRIVTGGQFAKAAFAKNTEGKYQHDSPENALHLENGMSSYVKSNGEAVVSFQTAQSEPKIIYVRSLETWFGEDAAKNINYGIIRDAVSNNLDQMTGLFGGSQEEHDWMKPKRVESVERANRFVRLLIGNREPNYILQYEDMPDIKSALTSMVDPRNQSEEENYADLRELGVLNGEQLNWSRIKTIGLILRQNRYFRTQAVKNPVAPFLLLQEELRQLDGYENTIQKQDAVSQRNGTRFRRVNGGFQGFSLNPTPIALRWQ